MKTTRSLCIIAKIYIYCTKQIIYLITRVSLFCVLKEHRRENFESESCSRFFPRHPREWKKLFSSHYWVLTTSTSLILLVNIFDNCRRCSSYTYNYTILSLSRAMIFPCYATHFSLNFLLLFFFTLFQSLVFLYFKWHRSRKRWISKIPFT